MFPKKPVRNRYKVIVEKVFFQKGKKVVEFEREDFSRAAAALGIKPPKNLGDLIYSIRYRTSMADSILATQPKGMEWVIEGRGISKYAFMLVKVNRIIPNPQIAPIKIPDATPEIVSAYALSDEQALLAKVRYNRLLDIFLGLAAYSLQNHLRTTLTDWGQVEIDEIYAGVSRNGTQFILPVQAKGGNDQLSVVQSKQDIAFCNEKYPKLVCRAISAQFIEDNLIALFELTVHRNQIRILEERHYHLVPSDQISHEELKQYATREP